MAWLGFVWLGLSHSGNLETLELLRAVWIGCMCVCVYNRNTPPAHTHTHRFMMRHIIYTNLQIHACMRTYHIITLHRIYVRHLAVTQAASCHVSQAGSPRKQSTARLHERIQSDPSSEACTFWLEFPAAFCWAGPLVVSLATMQFLCCQLCY